jgi:heat shock protein HtpX
MRGKWGSDIGLSARMLLTMVLLGLVYVAFIGIILLYVRNIAIVAIFVALFLGAQYYFSDRLVLAASGARIVSEDEASELHSAIERLCAMADLPKPKVAIANSAVPNAFATGRNQKHAVVAVTSSLLQRLEEPEIEAVLAHELSHVKNRDMLVMRYWFFIGAGGNRRDNNIVIFFVALAAIWIISFLITRALSRYREYAADRGSAIITAHPANLASALLKISGYIERVPTEDIRKVEGISQFFIIPAISRGSALSLLSTHPPIEKRIERLREMEAQLAGQSA